MDNQFFEKPVLNSPYDYPARHWELDGAGQPTHRIVESHRRAEFITPIPKPKEQKASQKQDSLLFDEELSTQTLEYARTLDSDTSRSFDKPTSGRIAVKVINHLRDNVRPIRRYAS